MRTILTLLIALMLAPLVALHAADTPAVQITDRAVIFPFFPVN